MMGLFSLFKRYDINQGVEEYQHTQDALLIDVRERDEYKEGHIPDSINIPLSVFNQMVFKKIKNKEKPLYIYCLSGGRSQRACFYLKKNGYSHVKNIGGISKYKGKII